MRVYALTNCVSSAQVYDVSSYMDEHPGGDDVILETTGNILHLVDST